MTTNDKTIIFDGKAFAAKRMIELRNRVENLSKIPQLVSVVHREDGVGMLYTQLKKEAAKSVGIEFHIVEVSFDIDLDIVVKKIESESSREGVNGLLVQKPTRRFYKKVSKHDEGFDDWWGKLTNAIDPKVDVDCLTRENLDGVYAGKSDLLPATSKAVLSILQIKIDDFMGVSVGIVGRSELVARPLAARLEKLGASVSLLGSKDNISAELIDKDVVISTTGVSGLIKASMVKNRVIVIDVGEPKGDVDFESVLKKATFITPVPGGVGPVTVVSLLENLVKLVEN